MSSTCTTRFRCSAPPSCTPAGTPRSRSSPPSTTTSLPAPAATSSGREPSATTATTACPGRRSGTGATGGSRAATAPVALAMSAHRQAWKSLVSAYIFISAAQRDLLSGLGLPKDRVFVRHNLIPQPERARKPCARTPWSTPGGSTRPRGCACSWPAGIGTQAGRVTGSCAWSSWAPGRWKARSPAWAAARPAVSMVGQVEPQRCAELMSAARAVLLPSAWQETFGLVAIEAMALGVPPIAAEHGSFPELITPGVDGALFRPGDPAALASALADVEEHPERYESYGKQARLTYEQRFDPESSIDRLLEIYRYAIVHPTGRASRPESWRITWHDRERPGATSALGELQRGDEVSEPARREDAAGSDGRVARRASSSGMRYGRPA